MDDVMAVLTAPEQNALYLEVEANPRRNQCSVGEKLLKKFGFKKLPEYEAVLKSAKEKVKDFVRFEYEIEHSYDLNFTDDV
jgi:hypothetical protein